MRGMVGPVIGGDAALRTAIIPYLGLLVEQVTRVILSLSASIRSLSPANRRRVRALVMTCAKEPALRMGARAVPVIPAVQGPAPGISGGPAEVRWLSLNDVHRLAGTAEPRIVPALLPHDDLSRFVLPGSPVLVLDTVERGQLAGLLKIGFRPPPLRPDSRGLISTARDALEGGWRSVKRGAYRLRHLALPQPLADETLSPTEQGFLAALRQALPGEQQGPADVQMCEGQGPIRRLGKGARWVLPRANPTVTACVRAWSLDGAWIYPAALAVLEGRDVPTSEARSAWTAR
jgi:hypothetical protein